MAKATDKPKPTEKPKSAEKPKKDDKVAAKPSKAGKAAKSGKPSRPNIFVRLGSYFRDVRSEMKRVVWPGRPEVLNSSLVVITALVFFSLFIALTDFVVIRVLGLLTKIGG